MKIGLRHGLLVYLITAGVFFAVDLLWIAVVAKGFYARHIGHMLRDPVNWGPAVAFYLLYIAGIVVLVVIPALKAGAGRLQVAAMGAMLGLVAYATFDLTALALLRGWPVIVALVDMAWGSLLTAAVASVAFWIIQRFLRRRAANEKKTIKEMEP